MASKWPVETTVGYANEHETKREVAGEEVHFIEVARLNEISAVESPAVKTTTLTVVKASCFGRLADVCRNGRIY